MKWIINECQAIGARETQEKEKKGKRERGIRGKNVEWGWGRDRKQRRGIYMVKPCPVVSTSYKTLCNAF